MTILGKHSRGETDTSNEQPEVKKMKTKKIKLKIRIIDSDGKEMNILLIFTAKIDTNVQAVQDQVSTRCGFSVGRLFIENYESAGGYECDPHDAAEDLSETETYFVQKIIGDGNTPPALNAKNVAAPIIGSSGDSVVVVHTSFDSDTTIRLTVASFTNTTASFVKALQNHLQRQGAATTSTYCIGLSTLVVDMEISQYSSAI